MAFIGFFVSVAWAEGVPTTNSRRPSWQLRIDPQPPPVTRSPAARVPQWRHAPIRRQMGFQFFLNEPTSISIAYYARCFLSSTAANRWHNSRKSNTVHIRSKYPQCKGHTILSTGYWVNTLDTNLFVRARLISVCYPPPTVRPSVEPMLPEFLDSTKIDPFVYRLHVTLRSTHSFHLESTNKSITRATVHYNSSGKPEFDLPFTAAAEPRVFNCFIFIWNVRQPAKLVVTQRLQHCGGFAIVGQRRYLSQHIPVRFLPAKRTINYVSSPIQSQLATSMTHQSIDNISIVSSYTGDTQVSRLLP